MQNPDEITYREVLREIKLMTQLRHTHIINFIGAVTIPEKLCLVTEYMPYGSLRHVIKKHRGLQWIVKLKLMRDTAVGMAFLHANNMVHRDLKPDNVLVASLDKHANITCKVCDFGSSRQVGIKKMGAEGISPPRSSGSQMTLMIGTPLYMAPEVLSGKDYGPKADIFSYAILLWQTFTESYPYEDIQSFIPYVKSGQRETIPPECPAEYSTLITECWSQNPDLRPCLLLLILVPTTQLSDFGTTAFLECITRLEHLITAVRHSMARS